MLVQLVAVVAVMMVDLNKKHEAREAGSLEVWGKRVKQREGWNRYMFLKSRGRATQYCKGEGSMLLLLIHSA